jgi:hypothetical protein
LHARKSKRQLCHMGGTKPAPTLNVTNLIYLVSFFTIRLC